MTLAHIADLDDQTTTHAAELLALLIEQYKEKPNLTALLTAFAIEIQALEDVYFELREDRLLDTAVGTQLDALSTVVVGQKRRSLNDDDYRGGAS